MSPSKSWTKTTEPRSYEQIYKYIEDSIEKCSAFIDTIEIDYYQSSSTSRLDSGKNQITTNRPLSVVTLQTWSTPLNQLRDACILHDIRNNKAVREILAAVQTGGVYGPITNESVILMKKIFDKTNEQIYSKIPTLISILQDCMNLMEQYFVSFYEIEKIQEIVEKKKQENMPDEYLETAYTYEKSRWTHMYEINISLKTLREMSRRIDDIRGIALSTLSKECQDLATRSNCSSLSYLFILPECYHVGREALNILRTWLSEDTKYNIFIQTTLKLLEEKYTEAKKAFEITKSQLSQIEYRAESHRAQLLRLEHENEINIKKCDDFEDRLNKKEREYIARRITYEVYEEQLNKLLKQSNDDTNIVDNHLAIARFQQDLKRIAKELPKLKAQVTAIETRIRFFQQRKQELIDMRNESKKLEREIQLALEEKILKENFFNRIQHCRDTIRYIHKCRTTDDLPQKIFHDLPVKIKDYENDDLTKAIRIVAKSIGKDWNKLYWQLPFHPTRGQEEIAQDVKNVDEKYQRGDVYQHQATDALNKWRRFHTRAKVDDLVRGLQKIRRFDVLQTIEIQILKPKRLLNVEHHVVDTRKKEIEDLNEKTQ